MDGLQFASSVISSLAWPSAVTTTAVLLRRPITRLLDRPLQGMELGPGGVKLQWWQAAATVRSQNVGGHLPAGEPEAASTTATEFAAGMLTLAEQASPMAAVGACEHEVTQQLRTMLNRVEEPARRGNMSELAIRAREHGLINDRTLTAVEGLGVMHMLALLGDRDVDINKAREYIGLTEGVLYALRARP